MIEPTPESPAMKFISDLKNELSDAWLALANKDYKKARSLASQVASNLPTVFPLINVEQGLPDYPKAPILGPEDT